MCWTSHTVCKSVYLRQHQIGFGLPDHLWWRIYWEIGGSWFLVRRFQDFFRFLVGLLFKTICSSRFEKLIWSGCLMIAVFFPPQNESEFLWVSLALAKRFRGCQRNVLNYGFVSGGALLHLFMVQILYRNLILPSWQFKLWAPILEKDINLSFFNWLLISKTF